MKKLMTLLLLVAAISCFSQPVNTFSPETYHFPDEGVIISPQVDYSKVLIVFDETINDAGIERFETEHPDFNPDWSKSYPWPNKRLYSLDLSVNNTPEATESLLSGLRKDPSVLSVYPSFIRKGDIAFLDNLLLVNMNVEVASEIKLSSLIEPYYGRVVEEIDLISSRTYAVTVPAGINIFIVCTELSNHIDIAIAQPNFEFTGRTGFVPDDPKFTDQWFLDQASDADIDAVEAWDLTIGSSSIAVAVIDGHGFDLAHAEMVGKYISPYNAVEDSNDPSAVENEEKHGTPCAGLIGALTNNSLGVASVGYNTVVVPIKMGFSFGSSGTFQTTELLLTRSCEHVMTSPYDIVAVSNSYTMGEWANIAIIKTAYSNMRTDSRGGLGSVVLASTGNDNTYNSVGYPSHYPHVLGVGSTDRYDSRSSFSNWGDSTDLAAPGTDTWTIDRTGVQGYSLTDYYEFGGTSAACPIAAGVVALIASANPGSTWNQLQSKLCSTCDKVGGYTFSNNSTYPYSTWSVQIGYGRVNAYEAVLGSSALDPPTNLIADVSGNNVHLSWTAPGGGGGTEEELIYDNNVTTIAYSYPGYSLSTHMSPSGPCQVIKLKYYTTIPYGGTNQFNAKIFNWTGTQPGTNVLYNSSQSAIDDAWLEIDVSSAGINVTTDFVVGFGSLDTMSYIGSDANYNNGRSWDLHESSQTWTTWPEAYLIRAVVLYPNGKIAELGEEIPKTISEIRTNSVRTGIKNKVKSIKPIPNQYLKLHGLLGYKIYRDGTLLNTSPVTNIWYDDNGLATGTYNYSVTAIYDEGESVPAGPVQAVVTGSTLDPPTNLQSSVNGSTVNLSWESPSGGVEEWLLYHDGSFEMSFASEDGGAGIAQLFTLSSFPVSLKEIRFFTFEEGWSQPMTVYVLSADGSTILGGPYATNGANNNWISIPTSVNINQSSFMIATYNDNPGGPYVGVDDSFYNETLFFGSHINGFTEMSNYGHEYVGSHEAKVLYQDKLDRTVNEWIRPTGSIKSGNTPDMYSVEDPLSTPYPEAIKALLGYNIYRDGTKINSSVWSTVTYTDAGLANGAYSYTVTAVYDEGESGPAGPTEATVNASGLAEPVYLSGVVSDDLVSLSWFSPGTTPEELIYDKNVSTGSYRYPGYTMSTHMSPSGPCRILSLKYYTTNIGANQFHAKVFNWSNNQPGTTVLYSSTQTAPDEEWIEVDVSEQNINVTGDFVVGFGSVDTLAYLGYDINYNNGRSWDLNEFTQQWTSWEEAYLIRAVVLYSDGSKAELGNPKGLSGYNLYRNNVKINEVMIPGLSTTDNLPGWGTYDYNVTAVYDEGESAFSNTFTVDHYFGIDEPGQIDAKVYPNPSNNNVYIETEDKIESLRLFTIDGKNVITQEKPGTQARIDVSKLDAGLYLLKVQTAEATAVYKLIVR